MKSYLNLCFFTKIIKIQRHFLQNQGTTTQIPKMSFVASVIPRVLRVQIIYLFLKLVNPYLFSTYATLNSINKSYWTASMVSTMVSVYLCFQITRELVVVDISDFSVSSPGLRNVLYTFTAYLVSDLVLNVRYCNSWPGAGLCILHHSIALIMMGLFFTSPIWPHGQIAQGLLAEFTNPFVNQIYFFKTAGIKTSALIRVNSLLLVAAWFVFRLVNLGILGWRFYLVYPKCVIASPFIAKINSSLFGIIYYMQWAWFHKILRGFFKQF